MEFNNLAIVLALPELLSTDHTTELHGLPACPYDPVGSRTISLQLPIVPDVVSFTVGLVGEGGASRVTDVDGE